MAKAGPLALQKDQFLFREGDESDAMYVIKSGTIAITKAKGAAEIVLAELKPGEMLGEMAFFDNRTRSASAKATTSSEVICLPFSALHAQFKTFPEWLKAMVKTVNSHLREANQRIKNLETTQNSEEKVFTPYLMTRYSAILSLVAHKYGTTKADSKDVTIPGYLIRDYTIQLFQEPTNKMQKFLETLGAQKLLTIEELSEGQQNIILHNIDFLFGFFEWYNRFLFSKPEKRVVVEERELPLLKALIFYGEKFITDRDNKEVAEVNLTNMQNDSMKDLGYLVKVEDVDGLTAKGLISEKTTSANGILTKFNLVEMKTRVPYWELVYTLEKVNRK